MRHPLLAALDRWLSRYARPHRGSPKRRRFFEHKAVGSIRTPTELNRVGNLDYGKRGSAGRLKRNEDTPESTLQCVISSRQCIAGIRLTNGSGNRELPPATDSAAACDDLLIDEERLCERPRRGKK